MIINVLRKNIASGVSGRLGNKAKTYYSRFRCKGFSKCVYNPKIAVLVTSLLLISACSSFDKITAAKKEEGPDITRPPVLIDRNRVDEPQTADPNEVISYEEWQKRLRRQADQTPDNADLEKLNSIDLKDAEPISSEKASYEEWLKSRSKEAAKAGSEADPSDDLSFEEWLKKRAESGEDGSVDSAADE